MTAAFRANALEPEMAGPIVMAASGQPGDTEANAHVLLEYPAGTVWVGANNGLHRIEQGTYGVCADCGAGVPEGRLEARPDAARCVACQSKRDRRRR